MKKRNFNSLKLNKKSISNLKINGGLPPASGNCVPAETEDGNCGSEMPRWYSVGAFVCWNR